MKIRSIKAWAVVKDGKLDAWEIYKDKDITLSREEKLIRVTIEPYEEKNTKLTKEKTRRSV